MRQKFRLYCRKKGGRFYIHNDLTGKQESLHTSDRSKALRLLHARNEAQEEPAINLQIAKAYLAAAAESFVNRTWHEVMAEFVKVKTGTNRTRSERAVMDKAFDSIRDRQLIETRSEDFLRVLEHGKISTNNYLRRFHNFAVDMGWLPWPVMPKRQWPAIHYKEKRAVTREEHDLILSRERNSEMRAFLLFCWHIGGSQSDVAHHQFESSCPRHCQMGVTVGFSLQQFSEVFKIRDADGQPYVLIGGQAVNYWAEHYLSADPQLDRLRPFTSEDIDFKGGHADVQRIARQLDRNPSYPPKVQMTALAGFISFQIGDLKSAIEVVRRISGISDSHTPAIQAEWNGQTIRVLDPISLLACKMELAATVSQEKSMTWRI